MEEENHLYKRTMGEEYRGQRLAENQRKNVSHHHAIGEKGVKTETDV